MPGVFADSEAKMTVRTQWNTPILQYLNRKYKLRYRYMGLPGVDLIDIKIWKDMIDEVTAFEVKAKINDSDRNGRRNINELRRNLQLLNIPSTAYFGPMEQVIIMGQDFDGTIYNQNKLITLYNLDFCDEITSRVATPDA